MAFQDAIQDQNQITALIGHSGTAGTAETRRITSSGTPGALDVMIRGTSVDIGGASAGTNVNIVTGTQQTLGTVGTVLGIGGTVAVSGASAGTDVNIVTGTQQTLGTVGTIPGVGSISNIGMLHAGTVVTTMGDLTGGTIDLLTDGTVQVKGGTIGSILGIGGTVNTSGGGTTHPTGIRTDTLGTVAEGTSTATRLRTGPYGDLWVSLATKLDATNDAVTVGGGTLAELGSIGTISGIAGGSLANVAKVHNAGTVAGLPDLPGGTVDLVTGVTTVTNLTSGSVRMTVGTVTVLPDLPGGTIDLTTGVGTLGSVSNIAVVHNAGTVAGLPDLPGGTIDEVTLLKAGTVQINPKSPTQVLTASALGTTGGTMTGTLSAASGAGTSHYVTGLQIVVNSGTTDVFVGFGTTATGGSVLARGRFVPGGGIMRDFTFPIQSGTNSEICYIIAGAGTALVAVNYWKGT